MNYETTRKYSRSLSQAFADERAVCVYLPPKRYADRALYWVAAVGLAAVVLSIIFQGVPK